MFQNKNNSDLESNILFEGVNPEILQSFSNPKNTIGKKEGSVIYQKGDLTEYLYLLIEGTVKLKHTEPDGTNIYINKTANSFFGETELIGKTQRKSSAVADSDCRMYTLNLNELKVLVKKENQILKNLFENKTFDMKEEDFTEYTKDFLDPETDFADLIRTTTEKPAQDSAKIEEGVPNEENTSVVEENVISDNEQGTLDKIITNEEVEETEEQASDDIAENNIIEEKEATKNEEGAFDKIITVEESEEDNEQTESNQVEENLQEDVPNITDKSEKEQKKDQLNESEGFVIEDSPAVEFIKPGDTLKTFVQEETEQEPTIEKDEEDSFVAPESEKVETDFSDYYETLLTATQNIFSKITIDETAQVIAESAADLVNATGGVLYIVDRESEELKAKVLSEDSIKDIRIKFSDGLQGTVAIEKKTVIVENPSEEKNFNPVIEDLTGIKIKNVIYYPILTKSDEAIAVLELYNSERNKFDSREIELLNAISPSILKALSNAKYVDILVQQRKIFSLGEITGFISDDIKTSLLKVKHYSSLLKKKDISPDVNKLLDLQIGQINSVEDFLKFTDAYAHGKNVAEQSTIKVSEAVTQILNFLAEYVDSRNTVIYKKIEEDTVINVDLPSLYFVCYQIAKNACDAMSDKGKIFVTSERDGKYIKIKFRDTGTGISETIKDKLFKPFVSFGKKQRPGLGLAIAEKIVAEQGGYMMVESVLGEGATFVIALPVVF